MSRALPALNKPSASGKSSAEPTRTINALTKRFAPSAAPEPPRKKVREDPSDSQPTAAAVEHLKAQSVDQHDSSEDELASSEEDDSEESSNDGDDMEYKSGSDSDEDDEPLAVKAQRLQVPAVGDQFHNDTQFCDRIRAWTSARGHSVWKRSEGSTLSMQCANRRKPPQPGQKKGGTCCEYQVVAVKRGRKWWETRTLHDQPRLTP